MLLKKDVETNILCAYTLNDKESKSFLDVCQKISEAGLSVLFKLVKPDGDSVFLALVVK